MLTKILRVKNVGLFADGIPATPLSLRTVTLLYAENGRGKSTLASILRACALGDSGRIQARRTIDSTELPEIRLLFETAAGTKQVSFVSGAWDSSHSDIMVFDSEFVEQNVYSGFEVRSDQRQRLLEFALGDEAVDLKNNINELTKAIEAATKRRSDNEKQLAGHLGPYKLSAFISLPADAEIEQRLSGHHSRIDAAKRANHLLGRQDPQPLPFVDFDLQGVIDVLNKQLTDLEHSAETRVKNHLKNYTSPDIEDWISVGQSLIESETCPFCGQSLADLALIRAYQAYFNQEYQELKAQVASACESTRAKFGNQLASALQSGAATNAARVEAWKDQLSLTTPVLAAAKIEEELDRLNECLDNLFEDKKAKLFERIGNVADYESLQNGLSSINSFVADYNSAIEEVVGNIKAFKDRLKTENMAQLQSELQYLEAVRSRYSTDVTNLITAYLSAEKERKDLDAKKTLVRKQLDGLMQTTLARYQQRVNELLASFHAEFCIEQLTPNYKGSGDPRTDYGLSIRNKPIKLGTRDNMAIEHSFGSSLSEADKRTLAFAFFLARLESNPRLSECIVVLDDPVSSLDLNRRRESIRLIAKLSRKCRQLITLSHDAHFIRDLRDEVTTIHLGTISVALNGIIRARESYSCVGDCDIDDICASPYYRNYKLVEAYVSDPSSANCRDVAIAIRPLLEGYYHRRFPGLLPKNMMFGKVISKIEQATAPSPLVNLQPLVSELREVNEYASSFHHDTNPEASHVLINQTELFGWAKRALNLVYK